MAPPLSLPAPPTGSRPHQRRAARGVADLRVDTSTGNARSSAKSDGARDSVPIARLRARGVFLLVMAFVVFAAFVLFVLSEMTHHHRLHQQQRQRLFDHDASNNADDDSILDWPLLLFTPEMQRDVHAASVWVLALAVPLTSIAAWFPVSISTHASDGVVRIKSPAGPIPTSPTTAALLKRLPLLQRIASRFRTNHYFRAYQTASWSLYAAFLAMVLGCSSVSAAAASLSSLAANWSAALTPSALLRLAPFCDFEHRSNVAVVAFIAQVLMISSVLALERGRDDRRRCFAGNANALTTTPARAVLILNNFNNSLLLVGAVLLAVASEVTRHVNSGESDGYSLSSGLGSLALFFTATLNTYGLGGLLSRKRGWRFYQPFMGGARFVLFQIISWTCFGAGVFIQGLYLLSLVLVEMELFVGVLAVAGSLFAVSQVVMMMSLLVFRSPPPPSLAAATASTLTQAASGTSALPGPRGIHGRIQDFADECLGALLVSMLVNLQWIPSALFFAIYAATTNLDAIGVVLYGLATSLAEIYFVLTRSVAIHMYTKDSAGGKRKDVSPYRIKYLIPPATSLALPAYVTYYHAVHDLDALVPIAALTAFLYVYAFTYRGEPQHTGVRMNRALMTRRTAFIESLVTYFSGKIIRVAPLDPAQHYVMAFHPHGIMPTTCMWLSFTEQWRALFPGVQPHVLTASVLHQIPLARDVMQCYGSLEVTREAFKFALSEQRSVLLVPGGQAEMLEQRSSRREVRIYTKHRGFIRVALEHGTPLVPVLSFKEGELMDNVKAPLVQRWFVKNLAFPFPYFPYGRGFLPIPRKVETTVVVGAAIPVPRIETPTPDDVDRFHKLYFGALEEMFHAHKHAAGCGDYSLVLI